MFLSHTFTSPASGIIGLESVTRPGRAQVIQHFNSREVVLLKTSLYSIGAYCHPPFSLAWGCH